MLASSIMSKGPFFPPYSFPAQIFMVSYFSNSNILLSILASIFIKDIGLQFSLLVASLSGFSIKMMVASENDFGSLSLPCQV